MQNTVKMTCLQAKIVNDKIALKKGSLIEDIDTNKGFYNKIEGMLIELLRKLTYKIKVMDYIARKAFSGSSSENIDINLLKKVSEVNS